MVIIDTHIHGDARDGDKNKIINNFVISYKSLSPDD